MESPFCAASDILLHKETGRASWGVPFGDIIPATWEPIRKNNMVPPTSLPIMNNFATYGKYSVNRPSNATVHVLLQEPDRRLPEVPSIVRAGEEPSEAIVPEGEELHEVIVLEGIAGQLIEFVLRLAWGIKQRELPSRALEDAS